MGFNITPPQQKQLKTLINAYVDNLAAQERVLRQLIVCLRLNDDDDERRNTLNEHIASIMNKLPRREMTPEEADRLRPHYKTAEDKQLHVPAPEAKMEIRVMTKEDEAKYGHPIGSTLISKIGDAEIWQVPLSNKEIRPVVINGKGKGTWFVPCTEALDENGTQIGMLSDNKYGLCGVEDPIPMVSYPNSDIHEINSSLATKEKK